MPTSASLSVASGVCTSVSTYVYMCACCVERGGGFEAVQMARGLASSGAACLPKIRRKQSQHSGLHSAPQYKITHLLLFYRAL